MNHLETLHEYYHGLLREKILLELKITNSLSMSQYNEATRLSRQQHVHPLYPDIVRQVSKSGRLMLCSHEYEQLCYDITVLGGVYEKRKAFTLVCNTANI